MKILVVIASLGGGGAERVAAQLANYFCEHGCNLKVCYWHDKKNKYEINSQVQLVKISGKSRVLRVSKEIKQFIPDIILSFADVSNVIAYTAKSLARSNAKLVTTIHSDLKLRDQNVGLNFKTRVLKLLHRYSCKSSDKVVVVSKGARSSFVDYYNINPEQCVAIYNPIHLNVNEDAPKGKDSLEPLRIISVGRLTLAKNYPLLLDVAEQLKKVNFNFFVDVYGEGELRSELEALISEKSLEGHVYLKGFSRNISQVFSEYDLFLMTSRWEGFGNVLVEALENKLYIISTDCPSGPREILANGEFGKLVNVDDSSTIVDLIVGGNYKQDLDLTKLKEHLNQFSLSSVGESYLNLFIKLL